MGKPSGITSQARKRWGKLPKKDKKEPPYSEGVRQFRKTGRTPFPKWAVYGEKSSFTGFQINFIGSLARSTHLNTALIVEKGP